MTEYDVPDPGFIRRMRELAGLMQGVYPVASMSQDEAKAEIDRFLDIAPRYAAAYARAVFDGYDPYYLLVPHP